MDNLKKIIKIQAYFRGTLVRKWLKDVRKTYEALAQELDKSSATHVTWTSERLCHPKVEKLSKKKVLLKNDVDKRDADKTEKVLKTSSIQNDNLSPHEQDETEVEKLNLDKILPNGLKQTEISSFSEPILREEITHEIPVKLKYNSVETQTKFSSHEESHRSSSEELDFYPVKNCKQIQTEEATEFYDNSEIHQRDQISSNAGFNNSNLNHFNFKSLAVENLSLPLNVDEINVMKIKDILPDKRSASPVRENHGSEADLQRERQPTRTKSPTFRPRDELQIGGLHVADTDLPRERQPTRTKSPTFRPRDELQIGGLYVADTDLPRERQPTRTKSPTFRTRDELQIGGLHVADTDLPRERQPTRTKSPTFRPRDELQSGGFHVADTDLPRERQPTRTKSPTFRPRDELQSGGFHVADTDLPRERQPTRTKSPTFRPRDELHSGGYHVVDTGNISAFTNATSVWESFNSMQGSAIHQKSALPQDVNELHEMRNHVAMELLWVQQAINSRKSYLRLKHEMKDSVSG
ncbi:hypothetical protein ACJMK2_002001 [Sinanodonta woodiana]|uniref:Uncharacterized protein n=1 Tax=Sinanodonta woodiana TaxID=1069815 RepID=A0ABD3XX41_SINWO